MIRLVLVEDHILVRQSIRSFLTSETIEVIGEASNGLEAVELSLRLQPDIVIMDIHLPQFSGIEATRRIKRQAPHIKIIALTAYNEMAYQRALVDAGADGFVLKTSDSVELVNLIKQVMIDTPRKTTHTETEIHPSTNIKHTLTDRELDVLISIARGWTNKQTGLHLNISDRTVQVHLQAIYNKLDVTNRTEAVLRAIVLGIISPIEGMTK